MTPTPSKPKRRFLRFCLRALLVCMLVVCVTLGWKVQRARKQREVVTWVLQSGGTVKYDHELNDDGNGTLVKDASPLTGLTGLKLLDLTETQISKADYVTLQEKLPNCEIRWTPPVEAP